MPQPDLNSRSLSPTRPKSNMREVKSQSGKVHSSSSLTPKRGKMSIKGTNSVNSSLSDIDDDSSVGALSITRPSSRQNSRQNSSQSALISSPSKSRLRGRSPINRSDRSLGVGMSSAANMLESLYEKFEDPDKMSSPCSKLTSSTVRKSSLESKVMNERRKKFTEGRSVESIRKNPRSLGIIHHIKFSTGPTMITSNIMLGSREDAADSELLKTWGVTHVLNVAKQVPNYHEASGQFVYMKISLLDSPKEDVIAAMSKAKSFIQRVEEINGRVFIHCIAGVSRSVTIIIMYFILKHRFPLRTIYNYILSCRPQIAVNTGFKLQSAQLEIQEHGYTSTSVPRAGKDWDFYEWNIIKHTHPKMIEPDLQCCTIS